MEKKNRKKHSVANDYLVLTMSAVMLNLVIHVFQLPNHFVFGGVTGFSILLSAVTGIGFAWYNLAINMVLLVLGMLILGRSFGLKTIYVTLLSALELNLLEYILPLSHPLTNQPILEMAAVLFILSYGSAVMFQRGACSGGTDIAAMILRKYVRMDMGKALLLIDFATVAVSFWIYGAETGMFSLVGLFARSFAVDNFIESLNLCKCFTIVTDSPEALCEYIRGPLNRGLTTYRAEGGYTRMGKTMVMTVVGRSQAVLLRAYLKAQYPDAFVIITNSSEVVGKGFLLE